MAEQLRLVETMLLIRFRRIRSLCLLEIDKAETKIAYGAMFVNGSGRNMQIQREPSVDASDQVTVHLAKQFQRRRFFRNQPISNKNCLWRPCLTGRHEMSNLYRGPSIDASYQVLVHLAKLFQRRRSSSSRYGVNSSTSRLKLQRMVGEQQKIARVCTIKMSLFVVKSSWYCSHVSDESRHSDGIFCM